MVRFREVSLDGGSGDQGSHFETGSPLRLHLELEARDPVDDLVVGFSVHRPDGELISGTNTQLERLPMPALRPGDRLCLTFAVERLPLLDGVYRLDVAAVSGTTGTNFDWYQKAAHLSVTDVLGRTGLVQFEGGWSLSQPEHHPARASGTGA